MKRILYTLLGVLALSYFSQGQSAYRTTAMLSAACTNATTTCNGTANSALQVGVGEYALASIDVSGTYTGATISFEFSSDGGVTFYQNTCTRSDANVQEGSEALANSSLKAWDCGVVAVSVFRVRLSAISTGSVSVGITLSPAQEEPAPTVALALNTTSFSVVSQPAVSNQASASQAAGGAGVRNIATAVCFAAGSTTAPALTQLTVVLRDGATGAGTVKWSMVVIVPASTGQNVAPFCTPINVIGTANTAMTLEFSALLTNLFESVTLQGYTTTL